MGLPAGIGLVLFAPDLVEHALGQRWHVATFLIQAFGLGAALNQIGFNWTAFYRAIGNTRPIAVATIVMFVTILGIGIPMLLTRGVDGYGVAMGSRSWRWWPRGSTTSPCCSRCGRSW